MTMIPPIDPNLLRPRPTLADLIREIGKRNLEETFKINFLPQQKKEKLLRGAIGKLDSAFVVKFAKRRVSEGNRTRFLGQVRGCQAKVTFLGNFTVAHLFNADGTEWGMGVAKRGPKDNYSIEVGIQVSVWRALEDAQELGNVTR